MSVAFKQFRVYVRGAIVVAVALAIVLVLVKNRNHAVRFWFFGLTDDTQPLNVVWLLLCTAAATLITWWVTALGWRLVRDVRELKRERAVKEAAATLDKRTAALNEQEKRIDDKLRRAIGETDEDSQEDKAGE
ncbi:MAG: hypothetical protein PVI86_18000 [Phycisphaerae bacterium]